jgi:hypothetical protein
MGGRSVGVIDKENQGRTSLGGEAKLVRLPPDMHKEGINLSAVYQPARPKRVDIY